jgi:hypothetical protein
VSARSLLALAVCAASLAAAPLARAAIVYEESVYGDFSGNGLEPTSISVGAGSNRIFGSSGRVGFDPDRDYFTVTIPDGYAFVALVELAGTTVNDQISFLGIQAGPQVTVPTSSVTATGLLGWVHYPAASVDTDILAAVGAGAAGATGFTPPLPAGDYAFWIQDTGDGVASYGFDIVIALPEPGVAAALLLACLSLGSARVRPPRA